MPGRSRFASWKEIFWRRAVGVIMTVYGLLGFFDLTKSEFLPDKYQGYTVIKLIPHLPLHWWTIGLLILTVGILLEGSHEAIVGRESEHEHTKAELAGVREELRIERDRSRPNFILSVGRTVVTPAQEATRKAFGNEIDAASLCELIIANSGAASVTGGWQCEVKHQTKTVQASIFIHTTGEMNFDGRLRIVRSDFIQEKSDITPITTGNRSVGWLGMTFNGITKDELVLPETTWIISCFDIFGRRWSLEHHMSGKAAEKLGYVPGGVIPTNPK
jgi:hypothetical protein